MTQSLKETKQALGDNLTVLDTIFRLTRIDRYSRRGFAFPAWRASASTIIQAYIEYLILQHEIPHTIVLHKGTFHLTLKEMLGQAHDHEIHCSYHILQYPEATTLMEEPAQRQYLVSMTHHPP